MALTHQDLGMKPVEYLHFTAVFEDGYIDDRFRTKVSLNETDDDLLQNLNETLPKHWLDDTGKAVKIIRDKVVTHYSTDWR